MIHDKAGDALLLFRAEVAKWRHYPVSNDTTCVMYSDELGDKPLEGNVGTMRQEFVPTKYANDMITLEALSVVILALETGKL